MAEMDFSYSEAKARLDEIVAEVRRKDISLEKSLDLLEEAGRLASHCTDLIDQADAADVVSLEAEEPGVSSANDGEISSESAQPEEPAVAAE